MIASHKRCLAKNKVFKEKESLEKELRHKIIPALVALQDNSLTRDADIMQYKSKEAIYQYKDQEHGAEWLDSIGAVKDNSLIAVSQDVSKDLNEKLSQANQQLADFAHIAAHDLKTPLRGIGTLADWIATDYVDKFDEEGRKKVKLLVGRTERMGELIDSILLYSEAGYVGQKTEEVDLNLLLTEAIDKINPPENIEISIENRLPILIRVKTAIMQIFENLLGNAVKYMDKPDGQIRISCVEENGFWKFSVADNGPGVEEEYFEKIFKIFQMLLPWDKCGSVGIGLAIVKKIIETYGGNIWVESKPGEGSTFFFTLPKQESEVIENAQLEANIVS